ncbi:MAG: dUTP diphosphatase [Methylobacteriaceae bacterium]|nr:dUTP diphosphatase [Rhodoblastus sp.]MCC0004905.1 dUTP diphosphatase [Methylobacteriaceae bacterium]
MIKSEEIVVRIARLPHAHDLDPPAYQSAEAAGLDLLCALDASSNAAIPAGGRLLVPTGFAIELPAGYEAQVRPRSGLAVKHGVTVLNSPGTIDSDYRGELKVLLFNAGKAPFNLERGMRIAQLVVAPVAKARLEVVPQLSETQRGDGGFGSTGTKLPPTN